MFEEENVHKFYDKKSYSFSNTRYKPWPVTKKFMEKYYNPSKLVLDSGCGNGRNCLGDNIIGMDYSRSLLIHAKSKNKSCDFMRGDIQNHPFLDNTFDLILSIAVIHHLLDRKKGFDDLYRISKKGCVILVYVWSSDVKGQKKFMQIEDSKEFKTKTENDVFATWRGKTEYLRYYHLYELTELENESKEAGFSILESGKEQESLYVILQKN